MEDGSSQIYSKLKLLYRRLINKPSAERLEEELQELIDQGAENGVISPGEGEMIQSIFELGDTLAREIMVPRTSVVGAPVNASLGQVLELVLTNGHSRLPVYEGDLDHIVGVLHAKDLLSYWGRPPEEPLPREIIRSPLFTPETKKIGVLLTEVRVNKSHMVIVLDEYGGTAGLVTLEDIIEEIVGDIHDEYDVEEESITVIDQETILVDAKLDIEDLEEFWGIVFPEGEFETVGGFIIDLMGRVPLESETIRYKDLIMTIRSADERKIKQVEVKRPGTAPSFDNGLA